MAVTRNGQMIKMTAAADSLAAASIGAQGFLVQKIIWTGAAAGTDSFTVSDVNGELVTIKADTSLKTVNCDFLQALEFTGAITLTAMTAGTLYIYLK